MEFCLLLSKPAARPYRHWSHGSPEAQFFSWNKRNAFLIDLSIEDDGGWRGWINFSTGGVVTGNTVARRPEWVDGVTVSLELRNCETRKPRRLKADTWKMRFRIVDPVETLLKLPEWQWSSVEQNNLSNSASPTSNPFQLTQPPPSTSTFYRIHLYYIFITT